LSAAFIPIQSSCDQAWNSIFIKGHLFLKGPTLKPKKQYARGYFFVIGMTTVQFLSIIAGFALRENVLAYMLGVPLSFALGTALEKIFNPVPLESGDKTIRVSRKYRIICMLIVSAAVAFTGVSYLQIRPL